VIDADPPTSWDQVRRVTTNSLLVAALGSFAGGVFLGSGERLMVPAGLAVFALSVVLAFQLRPPPETVASVWLETEINDAEPSGAYAPEDGESG